MRKECPKIGWGAWRVLRTGSSSVLAPHHEWRDNSIVVIHNFASKAQSITLTVGCAGERLVNLLTEQHSVADAKGKHSIALEAYGYRWFRVGSLRYLLNREKQ